MMRMKYSQFRAMWAITSASLRSVFRSPSAIVFSFVFPFIFILVFGFIGNSGGVQTLRVIVDANSDTTNELYEELKATPGVKLIRYTDHAKQTEDFQKGRVAGIIKISRNTDTVIPYNISLKSATSSND